MPGFLRAFARLLPLALLTGCAAKSPVLVTAPLLPAAGDPVAYLVGSIGPLGRDSAYTNQRILLRKRGSQYGAAAWWGHAEVEHTPKDIEEVRGNDKNALPGEASVFVMPLKPGDYEFYDFQFFWTGFNGAYSTLQAREQFLVPMHLEAGKAYYIGEFRSRCLGTSACMFFHGDQQPRDEVIARRQNPGLPTLQALNLNLAPAFPFVTTLPVAGSADDKPGNQESKQ
ncbi:MULTISPECIES: hypothetical protein [Pseudomonas]|uniref:hypothetical protein n=1 Tax=Pseudomonas TaxID=286 RepID=UPI00083DDD93|nr:MULTISPECIES: hypothetical protein [Pseudomonas]MCL8299674.1 hypothetical protein [Pseudomonas mosselii]MCL8340648.1 hypothetical protein [Pseudomonas mosselii]MCU9527255.1 hypothetical protein [Pseudomonas mosselii]MCU9534738.1 hypothetical protein [Pseudomonas mosselii]MCU9540602.1 hypothetical protein [Pseudomonas mosselii]